MAAYGLEQLLEDATQRRPSTSRLPPLNLAEVWATVDRYAVACLEQKKGLSLPNFCSLGWQVQRLRSKTTHRPYFQVASSFSRTYNVDTSRSGPPPQDQDLCPMEEFNFSKAAIRFSGTLTKDHVFSGLRLLIQQLGDVISQGRYVSLEFSFGKVLAKERDVRFAFAAQFYIEHGLEVPAGAAEDIEYRPTATYARVPDKNVLQSLCLNGTSLRDQEAPPQSARPDNERSQQVSTSLGTSKRKWEYLPEDGADVLTLCGEGAEESDTAHGAGEEGNSEASWPLPPAPAASSLNATAGDAGSSRGLGGTGAHRLVQPDPFETALHEHITNLEVKASVALREKAALTSRTQRELAEQERAKAARQAQLREHSACLRQQIEAEHQRRASERAPTPPLPAPQGWHEQEPTTLEPSGRPPLALDMSVANHHRRPNPLREALDEQVQAKRNRQNAQRAIEKRIEARLLEAQAQEDLAQQSIEKASRASERESLEAAWREQARICEIRKALEAMESNGRARSGGKASSLGRHRLGFGGILPGMEGDSSSTTASSRGGQSSSRGSCVATPRRASAELTTPLGSARGSSIGAAASLALQTKPGEAA